MGALLNLLQQGKLSNRMSPHTRGIAGSCRGNKSSHTYCSFGGPWSGRHHSLKEISCFFVIWLILCYILFSKLTQAIERGWVIRSYQGARRLVYVQRKKFYSASYSPLLFLTFVICALFYLIYLITFVNFISLSQHTHTLGLTDPLYCVCMSIL